MMKDRFDPARPLSPETVTWRPDLLGEGYEAVDLALGADPEGEGQAVATLVRHRPTGTGPDWFRRPALLWVHGMTDYFFQTHVAEHFHTLGYAFYGLDLRKCGRARQDGQRWHYATDLANYFPDLTAATRLLGRTGHPGVIPIAHSTGGLIVPLWLDDLRRHDPDTHDLVPGAILNSPWLDLQYPQWVVRLLRPAASVLGPRLPDVTIPGGNLGTYGASIHADAHGEWDFNTTFKPLGGHPKYLVWLAAILAGQKRVQSGEVDVGAPVLTLCSSDSYLGHKTYSAAFDTADTVLDVEQIRHWAPNLGSQVTVASVGGARHDVFLSLPRAREEALSTAEEWLRAFAPTS